MCVCTYVWYYMYVNIHLCAHVWRLKLDIVFLGHSPLSFLVTLHFMYYSESLDESGVSLIPVIIASQFAQGSLVSASQVLPCWVLGIRTLVLMFE